MRKFLKLIHGLIPFKKQLFAFIKMFWTPPHQIYQHLHFKDNFMVKVGDHGTFRIRHYGYQIENEIFWKGVFNGWEKVSLTIWAELCNDSKVIIDIGANTGVYSLVAKTINDQALVYAFDPVERVYDKLCHNIRLNGYDIITSDKAVSNFNGIATIYDKNIDHTYSVTVNKDRSNDQSNSIPVQIETLRLDTFIKQNGISQIDLLKIDVETHEVEVLQGLGEYLKIFKPSMIIEILNDDIAKGVEKIISDIGYDYYVIDENSGIKKVDALRKSDYFNFLICMPDISCKLDSLRVYSDLYLEKSALPH